MEGLLPAREEFHSFASWRETLHTLSLVEPLIRPGDRILDVGCGHGYVAWGLERRRSVRVTGVDIVDQRRKPFSEFLPFDGVNLRFADASFDIVMLNFVLHHVPDPKKAPLLSEVLRVARRQVFVLEDTPRNAVDRWLSRRHGVKYRTRIRSDAGFGFLTRPGWLELFRRLGFVVQLSHPVSRFARWWLQPYARCAFVLGTDPSR